MPACSARDDADEADAPAATTMSFSAAADNEEQTAASILDKIISNGELVVALSPDFAPMEFIDSRKNGQEQYVGTDPWFAEYIAGELGVALRISAMNFNALENAVISGDADLIISGFAATERRAGILELSDYYNVVSDDGSGFIVLKEATGDYQTADNFNGKTIAVQAPSTQYDLLLEQLPGAIPEPISQISDGVKMLLTKSAEALAVDGSSGRDICENYPDLAMAGFKFKYQSEGNVICMKKGETELCERINGIIAKATAGDLFDKWLEDAKTLAVEIGWQD